jgi:hypothetical protein
MTDVRVQQRVRMKFGASSTMARIFMLARKIMWKDYGELSIRHANQGNEQGVSAEMGQNYWQKEDTKKRQLTGCMQKNISKMRATTTTSII